MFLIDKTLYHIVFPTIYIESIPLHDSIASILCLTTFFTMDVQKQLRGCHCFGMRSRSRYISQFPSGEGWEIAVFSSGIKEVPAVSLQGGDSKKHVSWNPLENWGFQNHLKFTDIFFWRIVGTESLFAHIRFIEIL